MFRLIFVLFTTAFSIRADHNEKWHGANFPYDPQTDSPSDSMRSMQAAADCDNRMNTLDWNNSPLDYLCFENRTNFRSRSDIWPVLTSFPIPQGYHAAHICTNESINYPEDLPTFGNHRAVWARYGSYRYLPKQRWLHNLEHGAIVALYHPCANRNEISLLRETVRYCVYRHIITPSRLLKADMPLALLAWGRKLEFSKFDKSLVKNFIRQFANRGPEDLKTNGQFRREFISDPLLSVHDDNQFCN